MTSKPFWEALALADMSAEQWERLCDGCGRCCAVKLQDVETGAVHYTRAACRLLDTESCRCTDYANRARRVADCAVLSPDGASSFGWLPASCAYRRLAEGRTLAPWHPLVSDDPESVHLAGISVRGQLISEMHVHDEDLPAMLVHWTEEGSND